MILETFPIPSALGFTDCSDGYRCRTSANTLKIAYKPQACGRIRYLYDIGRVAPPHKSVYKSSAKPARVSPSFPLYTTVMGQTQVRDIVGFCYPERAMSCTGHWRDTLIYGLQPRKPSYSTPMKISAMNT